MSTQNLKEDLEFIAALAASTAGFMTNNVNGMMVGDSAFIKSDLKPKEVVVNAQRELIKEYGPQIPQQRLQFPQPQPQVVHEIKHEPVTQRSPVVDSRPEENNQLMFNFDNTPTAQNIYYKLNLILEKIESLNVKVYNLSEQVNKKKVSKIKED